jgi:hypothetical protein
MSTSLVLTSEYYLIVKELFLVASLSAPRNRTHICFRALN